MITTLIGRSWLLLAALVTVTAGCDDDGIIAPTPVDPEPKNGLVALVTLVPSKTIYSVGESVVTDMLIVNGMNVFAVPFHLTYNPDVLQYVSSAQGTFLNSDGSDTVLFVTPMIDELVVALSRLEVGPGASGDGVLATFEFLATGAGDGGLAFTGASLIGPQAMNLPAQFSTVPVRVVP